MRPFLARFSESVWSGHLPSWADFITTTPELKFLVPTMAKIMVISLTRRLKTLSAPYDSVRSTL